MHGPMYIKFTEKFSLQIFIETFFILRRTDRDEIKNVYWYNNTNNQLDATITTY